jgi:tetratricopeptide (TPR) repeat protein
VSDEPRLPLIVVIATAVAIAGIPFLRGEDPGGGRFTRGFRAAPRPDVPSRVEDVAVSGGIADASDTAERSDRRAERRDERRVSWGEVGLTARYDAWLAPEASSAALRIGSRSKRLSLDAASRDVDVAGRPLDAVPAESDAEPGSEPAAEVAARAASDEIDAAVLELRGQPAAAAALADGLAAFRARDYEGAFRLHRRAAPLAPDSALPRLQLALSQFALGDYDGASYSLRRALELLPALARLPCDPLPLYGEPRDFEEQQLALDSHCRIFPADREARVVRAYLALGRGDPDLAVELLAPLVAEAIDDPLPAFLLESVTPPPGEVDAGDGK